MSRSPLSETLQDPVTSQARTEIIRRLWPELSPDTLPDSELDWSAYFNFYNRECHAALVNEGQHLWARCHADVLQIAQLLVTESTKEAVKLMICQRLTPGRSLEAEDRMLSGTINLATRLLAMVNAGPLPNEISSHQPITWDDGSFGKAVHTHFDAYIDSDSEDVILGTDLTARNIDHDANIEIIWTDNLVDHLRLADDDRKLCIFHHASFLKRMEHIQSTDRKTRRWLQGQTQANSVLTRVDLGLHHVGSFKAGHASRRLEHFKFWRERLGALRDAVEEATPHSKALLKALSDRKQGDRWLNSWVALVAIGLTLFFGLVQSIEGAVQVYKAYHPTAG